jgi:L-alanine-DL-glutamate epimerase-like enolase superfamily enzyme
MSSTAPALGSCDVPVTKLEASAYTIPTDAPEADGTMTWDSTTLVLVQVHAGDQVGTGWTYGPSAVVALVTGKLASVVEGRSALDASAVYYSMWEQLRNAGRPGIGSLALSAIDTAMWDLQARLVGLPLHRLLGAHRDEVPVYGSGGFTTYDDRQTTEQLEGWVGAGIPRVKIKVGESSGTRTGRDTARVRLARKVIGPFVELFVDANGGYGPQQAIRWYDEVAASDVRWFEEPVSSDDLDGLRRVRDAVGADVTAGEYGYDLTYFERMCAAQAVDCLQIDVTRCGGITEWRRVAAVAAAHHLDVSGHCAPNVTVPVAAATPNFRHLEWFHDHVRIETMLFDGAREAAGGLARLTDAPGNGVTWRAQDAEQYRVR